MNHLAEVRQHWPQAKRSKSGSSFWAVRNRVQLMLTSEIWEVAIDSDVSDELPALIYIGQTIPEAMFAAGFGVRTQGLFRILNRMARNDCAGRILSGQRIKPHAWYVAPQSRQRPCKGVRLGKRKRSGGNGRRSHETGTCREQASANGH